MPVCVNLGTLDALTKTCKCPFGYVGLHCERFEKASDLSLICDSNPCKNNGNCAVITADTFICNCQLGFAGDFCEIQLSVSEDPCKTTNICWNDGQCRTNKNSLRGYECDCTSFWTGPLCKEDIDECTLGGTTICRFNATCANFDGSYTCNCIKGRMGKTCQADVNECDDPAYLNPITGMKNPCLVGECVNLDGDFKCDCPAGLGGKLCERPAHWCDSSPCGNDALCHIIHDKISCTCGSLMTGTYCDIPVQGDANGVGGYDPNQPKSACNPTPCGNGGQCDVAEGTDLGYFCTCQPGWNGDDCTEPEPQCSASSCQYGTCKELFDYETTMHVINPSYEGQETLNYHCICEMGYTGLLCEINIDDCFPDPCHGYPCTDYERNFECDCEDGITGHYCETDIDECMSVPCAGPYTIECQDLLNEYKCICKEGWTGTNCDENIDECDPDPCDPINSMECLDQWGDGGFICECLDGFTGELCTIDINECESNPCQVLFFWNHTFYDEENSDLASGTCDDQIDKYECTCPEGRLGIRCDEDFDECLSAPCLNNAYDCTHGLMNVNCNCTSGFTGHYCEIDIDECASTPCVGKTENATCVDGENHYICNCGLGWRGLHCDTFINYCDSSPCSTYSTCYNQLENFIKNKTTGGIEIVQTGQFYCHCPKSRTGQFCEIIVQFCESDPCQNTGVCVQDEDNDQYICLCPPATKGWNCETFIDSCQSNPCQNGSPCLTEGFDTVYYCQCVEGFAGLACEVNINECDSNPCLNNGFCIDKFNAFECKCLPGFAGIYCHINNDECVPNRCSDFPGVVCIDLVNKFRCDCPHYRYGSRCENLEDHCDSTPCQNGGTCTQIEDLYWCECVSGFVGDRCQNNHNECLSEPCPPYRSKCIDKVNEYFCQCLPGYNGTQCLELNECDSNPCQNGGVCNDLVDGWICHCLVGWYGVTCDNDILNCASHPCFNGGTCSETNALDGTLLREVRKSLIIMHRNSMNALVLIWAFLFPNLPLSSEHIKPSKTNTETFWKYY